MQTVHADAHIRSIGKIRKSVIKQLAGEKECQ